MKPQRKQAPWVPLVGALATALLSILSLPDFNFWPLAFIVWLPLFFLLPDMSFKGSFGTAWLAGFLAHLGIFYWLVHTVMTMSGLSLTLALVVLVVFAMVHGLAWGLAGVLIRGIGNGPSWLFVLIGASIIPAVEFLVPQLFTWHLGSAFWETPVMLQGVDVTGMAGASFVAAGVSGGLAVVLRDLVSHRKIAWSGPLIAAGVLGLWMIYGFVGLPIVRQEVAEAPTVRLALVQPDITPEDKKVLDYAFRASLIDRLFDISLGANLDGVQGVIWPEGSFPGRFIPEGRSSRTSASLSRHLIHRVQELGVPLIFGTVTKDAQGNSYNSAVHIGPDGRVLGQYNKRKLLAFGEYMPLADRFPGLKTLVQGVGNMSPGDGPLVFSLGDGRGGASICYEAIKSQFTRESVIGSDADLIINLTNDGWFGEYGAPSQHLMIQVPRAVELRMPLVRVTQTGITAVVSGAGDFMVKTALHEQRAVVVDVPRMQAKGVYATFGPVFGWLCVLMSFGGILWAVVGHLIRKKSLSTTMG